MTFRAVLIEKTDDGITAGVTDLDESQLPDRPVAIDVTHSTVNYKDGMAVQGRPGIVRDFPMVPGVDVVGTTADAGNGFDAGQRVTINGWDVGESHWGGLAQKCRVDAEWVTPLPDAISNEQAAAIGTAGYTAMLCVMRLEELGITPDSGPVLVTGAAGGVGSVAVAVLAKLGYDVTASTGRPEESDYLMALGANQILDRAELSGDVRPLAKAIWAAAIDPVGSNTLANVLSKMQPNGVVAACGLAQGLDLPATVMPFILRGVTLAGVNCVHEPQERRADAWNRLAVDLGADKLDAMTTVVGLDDVVTVGAQILDGQIRGRVVVDVNR